MNSWIKKIPEDPENEFRSLLSKCRNTKEKKNFVNGKKNHLAKWNPLQIILFWGAVQYKSMIHLLLQNGADPNSRSRAGINFFHLYLFFLHYHPQYDNEESFDLFVDMLRFGFQANSFLFFHKKGHYALDILFQLRTKPVISTQFLSTPLRSRKYFKYKPLSVEHYNTLSLLFLCLGGKFHNSFDHQYLKITFHTVEPYLYILFFKQYILQKFKLPDKLEDGEIQKRVNFLSQQRKHIHEVNSILESLHEHDVPLNAEDNEEDRYFNTDLIENCQLQRHEFLPPLSVGRYNYFFHRNYFLQSFLTNENIFTREPISPAVMENWLDYIQNHYCFPLETLEDCLQEYPFLFRDSYNSQRKFYKMELISFLEEIFSLYNPYNHFPTIRNLSFFQLKFLCHQLFYETKLFPKFEKLIAKPKVLDICFVIFEYYQKAEKNMNILCYFIEEALADLKSYERVHEVLNTLEDPSNSNLFFQEYLTRFHEFHPIYMKKFIENMLVIYRYRSQL